MHWRKFIIRVTNWQALCYCPDERENKVGKQDRRRWNGESRQRWNILERKNFPTVWCVVYGMFCCVLCVLILSWFNYLFRIFVLFSLCKLGHCCLRHIYLSNFEEMIFKNRCKTQCIKHPYSYHTELDFKTLALF